MRVRQLSERRIAVVSPMRLSCYGESGSSAGCRATKTMTDFPDLQIFLDTGRPSRPWSVAMADPDAHRCRTSHRVVLDVSVPALLSHGKRKVRVGQPIAGRSGAHSRWIGCDVR